MWANLFSVVFPWILAVVFYSGNWVQVRLLFPVNVTWETCFYCARPLAQVFLDYGSVITTIPLNLMLPCYLYIVIAQDEGTFTALLAWNTSCS